MSAPSAPARIRLRSLPATAGLSWIRRGMRTFWRRPLGFVGLWLFATLSLVIALVVTPWALALVAASLPLLSTGFMLATEDVLDDGRLRPTVFWAPLATTPSTRRAMFAIMLVYAAAILLLAVAANTIDGGETRRWIEAATTPGPDGKPPVIPPMSANSVFALRVMSLGTMLVSIPLWHAPALIQWGRLGAAQAMFSSVVAIWRTRGAFALFLLGWFAIFVGFATLVQLLMAVFGVEAVSLAAVTCQMVLSITFYVSIWFGFVDTFEITAPVAFRTVMADNDAPTA